MNDQEVSTNKIPRLLGQDVKWKVLFEAAINHNDTKLWASIKEGPYVPIASPNTNQAVDRQMKKRDDKALSMSNWVCLGKYSQVSTTTLQKKGMHDAVVEMFEENTELKDIKKNRLKQQLDRFKFKEGERLNSVLQTFIAIVNEIRTTYLQIFWLKHEVVIILSGEWYTTSKFIKEKANFPNFKLDDVISFLQAA